MGGVFHSDQEDYRVLMKNLEHSVAVEERTYFGSSAKRLQSRGLLQTCLNKGFKIRLKKIRLISQGLICLGGSENSCLAFLVKVKNKEDVDFLC